MRNSYNSKISQSQGAAGGNALSGQQSQGQNSMRMSFTKYGGQKTAQGVKESKQNMNMTAGNGMVNHHQVNSAMLIQQNSQSSP